MCGPYVVESGGRRGGMGASRREGSGYRRSSGAAVGGGGANRCSREGGMPGEEREPLQVVVPGRCGAGG